MIWERKPNLIYNIVFSKGETKDINDSMDKIFELFPDKYPYLIEEAKEHWTFSLMNPTDHSLFIDPKLKQLLKKMFKISIEEMSNYYRVEKFGKIDFMITMLHSNAIILATIVHKRISKKFKYIVHVDSHEDLMPTLFNETKTKNILSDPFFKSKININEIPDVTKAIQMGLISKGNFLTVHLLSKNTSEIIYVNSEFKNKNEPVNFWLGFKKNNIKVSNKSYEETEIVYYNKRQSGCIKMQETYPLPIYLKVDKNDLIWLDLDLDYFCNRFDGKSENKNKLKTAREKSEFVNRMKHFLKNLENANWKNNIAGISLALSPGFFPSEYWEYSLDILLRGIKKIISYE